jgi:hypothetical protein
MFRHVFHWVTQGLHKALKDFSNKRKSKSRKILQNLLQIHKTTNKHTNSINEKVETHNKACFCTTQLEVTQGLFWSFKDIPKTVNGDGALAWALLCLLGCTRQFWMPKSCPDMLVGVAAVWRRCETRWRRPSTFANTFQCPECVP